MDPILLGLQNRAGIHFMGVDARLQAPGFAMDAQPVLVTTSNAGIPSFLSTYIDPAIIKVLLSPMKAAEIVGDEVKKGDWTTKTAMFLVVESTGEVSSYGDYSENGVANANTNFPERQSYHYQVITQWGEMELANAGLARVDWANQLNLASVLVLNKFQNKSYFLGVSGLQNYGLLNDPSLIAPIAPVNVGGNITWPTKDALGVYGDIQALYTQLQSQSNGLVDLETPMTLAMSPISQVGLTKTTSFNVNVEDLLKKNFPNMTVKTAPEYATSSGQLLQLIVNELEGQRTASCAFTEKLRAHPIVIGSSSFKQKKSQGTWGTIIFREFLIAQMIGV
jgi:hypothetical protein